MAWVDWATEVLHGISATLTQANLDSLWGWSNAESGSDVMRWNNPLNTTQPWPGATNANSVGVKIYPSEVDGAQATVVTLLNGNYPTVVAHLQSSVPRGEWGDACGQLRKWGTGCGWLNTNYGAAPGAAEVDMTPDQDAKLTAIYNFLSNPEFAKFNTGFDQILAAIKAIPMAGGGGLTQQQAQMLQETHDAILRIEAAFKAS